MLPRKLNFKDFEAFFYEADCKIKFPQSYTAEHEQSIRAYIDDIQKNEEIFLEVGGNFWGTVAIRKEIDKLD